MAAGQAAHFHHITPPLPRLELPNNHENDDVDFDDDEDHYLEPLLLPNNHHDDVNDDDDLYIMVRCLCVTKMLTFRTQRIWLFPCFLTLL